MPAPGRLSCLSATLEIPAGAGANGHTYYAILPIQPQQGGVQAPIFSLTLPPTAQAAARITALADTLVTFPDWESLIEACHRAHCLFPDVHAIAWDWVLTSTGPVLLEGNTGWGLAIPQSIYDRGFLATERLSN